MYFVALAVDFDGTIARHGRVEASTYAALKRFKETGRRLLLVTGRELRSLADVDLGLFDRVVAENGAVVYNPSARHERLIAAGPPAELVSALKRKNVEPLSVGQTIVATWSPNETVVMETLHELGLEHQAIFNKGAIMVLPPGVNKASGLNAALAEIELSAHNVVGVGDAENDFAFLEACGCAAAVGNATPALKKACDVVLETGWGAGVEELTRRIHDIDAAMIPAGHHGIRTGCERDGRELRIVPYRGSVLIAGSSGVGKSRLATALMERMAESRFQFCVFDPEGDYNDLENVIAVGHVKAAPSRDQARTLLRKQSNNVVVNTQALELEDRPTFFMSLLPQILSLRARYGRPHWLLMDEAHHLMPPDRDELRSILPRKLPGTIMITVHPEAVAVEALRTVDTVLAVGPGAADVIAKYCRAVGIPVPTDLPRPRDGEGLCYRVAGEARVVAFDRPQQEHRRHTRKYAEGRLGPDRSFYFRGPDNILNLRAHNLVIFLIMAAGVDDRTWEHHLRAGDYSRWFREAIKDDQLANDTAKIEGDGTLDARESRRRVAEAISKYYTVQADDID